MISTSTKIPASVNPRGEDPARGPAAQVLHDVRVPERLEDAEPLVQVPDGRVLLQVRR